MQVSNKLIEESFHFTEDKTSFLLRGEEINDLDEVSDYCVNIGEKIQYTDFIWEIPIEKDVLFMEYLYEGKGEIRDDDRRHLQEMLSKKWQYVPTEDSKEKILVSLGRYDESVSNMKEYIGHRRLLLSQIKDVQEYEEFMYSCFPNSYFASNILKEMKNIKNFVSA